MPLHGHHRSKPLPGTPIDWSAPLAQGLISLIPLHSGQIGSEFDLITGSGFTLGTSPPAATGGVDGQAYLWANSSNNKVQAAAVVATSYTVLCRIRVDSMPVSFAALRSSASGGLFIQNSSGFKVRLLTSGTTASTIALTAGRWQTAGYTYDHPTTTGTYYVDGVACGGTTASLFWNSTWRFIGSDGAGDNLNGAISWQMAWNRALGPVEVGQATANPWSVFGTPRSYFLMTSAGAPLPPSYQPWIFGDQVDANGVG